MIKTELEWSDGGRPVYLMGESFGGILCLALAHKLGDYVDRMVRPNCLYSAQLLCFAIHSCCLLLFTAAVFCISQLLFSLFLSCLCCTLHSCCAARVDLVCRSCQANRLTSCSYVF
jgi:hypothetical protein